MYKKFIKTRKVILPTLTALLIAGQLTACSPSTKQETASLIKEEPSITLEIATPKSIEQGTSTSLQWIEVGSLTTNPELRTKFENLIGITGETGKKVGNLYGEKGNQNITLKEALQEQSIDSLLMLIFKKDKSALAKTVDNTYLDLEKEKEEVKISMGINGYFNLLPDNEPGYSNPHKTLTRAEFMSALMRSVTPVSSLIKKSEQFSSLVGNTEYDVYAERVEKEAYLNTKDKSLNASNYNVGAMSRAEAIYLIMNHFFTDELDKGSKLAEGIKFEDVKNGGDIKETKNFTGEQARLKEFAYMLENPQDGVSHGLYKALALAYEKGFIDTKVTRWNEGITKAEGLDLIIKALGEVSKAGILKNGYDVVEEETEETNVGGAANGIVVTEEENNADPYARYKKQINLDKEEVEQGLDKEAKNITIEEMDTTMVVVKAANVREEPGTGYNSPTFIERGQEIKVTGKTSNSWYRINLPEYNLEEVFVPLVSLKEKEGTSSKQEENNTIQEKKENKNNKEFKVENKQEKKIENKQENKLENKQEKKIEQTKKTEPVKKAAPVVKKEAPVVKKEAPVKKPYTPKKEESKKKGVIGYGIDDVTGEKILIVNDGSAFNTNCDDIEE